MQRRIRLETQQQLRDMIHGPEAPEFSRYIIDEIAVAIEHHNDPSYEPGFQIDVEDIAASLEIIIDPKEYRTTIEKNIAHLVAAERYEDCHYAMRVLSRLDEIESELAVSTLLEELDGELPKPKRRTRRRVKQDVWSKYIDSDSPTK